MLLALEPLQASHLPELARICHGAFAALHDRHQLPRDIPDLATAEMIVSHLAGRPDYAAVAASLDGRIVGSNFLLDAAPFAGVGPITVDPEVQSRGVGRALMQWAIDEAQRRGIAQVRLFQEAINTTSLSLYTALGFDWRASAAALTVQPAGADDGSIRPLSADDLERVEALSRRSYGFSRAADAAQLLAAGFPGFVRIRDGRVVAYQVASLFGHSGAETDDDLFALLAQAARHLPEHLRTVICPLDPPERFRRALAEGHRTSKLLSYMSYGAFTPPPGPHFPSIQA